MSKENLDIVRASLAAYTGGDETTMRRLTAENIVISTRPDQPDAREHHGYEGLWQMSAEWLEAWDEHTFEAARIWDVGDLVFVTTHESGRGRLSGVPMETESTFVFTLSLGKILRLQIFGSESEALKATGLA